MVLAIHMLALQAEQGVNPNSILECNYLFKTKYCTVMSSTGAARGSGLLERGEYCTVMSTAGAASAKFGSCFSS
jgi:hypothetical protein